MNREKLIGALKKGKLALLILLAGILLLLLPSGKSQGTGGEKKENTACAAEQTERRMEELLRHTEGVGRVRVMLTLQSSSRLTLARDQSDTRRQEEEKSQSQVVTLPRGSGCQEVVVTEELYPTYRGALVTCEGAADPQVRLQVVKTVSVLTGLGSDRITVVQWQS